MRGQSRTPPARQHSLPGAAWNRRAALTAGVVSVGGAALASGALAQTRLSRAPVLNVRQAPFNAAGDGATDDRAAIQAAIDAAAAAGGGCVLLPGGTYNVGAEPSGPGGLQLKSRVMLQGEAPRATILRLAGGANRHLLYGPAHVDRLWGSGSAGGLESWALRDLEIDGNRAANRAGSGVWVYGYKPFVDNLFIGNVAEHGWRTEWGTGGPKFGMEGVVNSVHVDTCGRHGLWFAGPHDSVVSNVFVIDASQSERDRWDGFHLEGLVGSRFVACHAWTRARAVRPRHALHDSAGVCEFIGCHFEGAFSANVYAAGQGSTFDACRIFAAANGRNVVIKVPEIVMRARIALPLEGGPSSKGVVLGESEKDWVAACDLDLYVTGQAAGAVDFTHSSGDNSVRLRGFQQDGVVVVGRPKPSDDVDIFLSGPAGATLQQQRRG